MHRPPFKVLQCQTEHVTTFVASEPLTSNINISIFCRLGRALAARAYPFLIGKSLENSFVKLPHPSHDLIIIPHVGEPSKNMPIYNCPRKTLPPICHEKLLYRGRHYAIDPLTNHVGVCVPSIFLRKC